MARKERQVIEVDPAEVIKLGAKSPEFYSKHFFPQTVHQSSPQFHKEMWEYLDSVESRYLAFGVFRGGAKTTLCRLYLSRRVAYAMSYVNLIVGKSEQAAVRSLQWIKQQVLYNKEWARLFGLKKGAKWTDTEAEIVNEAFGHRIWILAIGISGSTRGINLNDKRPDFILVDDPHDIENSATPEGRNKVHEHFFGDLLPSLAPVSESEHSKIALLQTPFNEEDTLSLCQKDAMFRDVVYGVFDDEGKSRWPARWSTEELLQLKESYASRNLMHIWVREYECKIISRETSTFLPEWLKYYDVEPPAHTPVWIAIDPVPPPSTTRTVNVTPQHDFYVIRAFTVTQNGVFLLDSWRQKMPNTSVALAALGELVMKYAPRLRWVAVETILFARAVAEIIKKWRQDKRLSFMIKEVEDRRHKRIRIEQEIGPLAQDGQLFVKRTDTPFIEQFLKYPDVNHDDELDAVAIGLCSLPKGVSLERMEKLYTASIDEDDIEELEWARAAP